MGFNSGFKGLRRPNCAANYTHPSGIIAKTEHVLLVTVESAVDLDMVGAGECRPSIRLC